MLERCNADALSKKNGVPYVGKSGTLENLSARKSEHQRSEKKLSGTMFYAWVKNVRKHEDSLLAHYKAKGQAQLNVHEKSGAADEAGFVYVIVGTSPLLSSTPVTRPCVKPMGPLKADGTPDMRFAANR